MARLCSVEGCHTVIRARGWCATHYSRWRRTGNVADPVREPEEWRFARSYVVTESGCWFWTKAKGRRGYGLFYSGDKYVAAHRWSYEHFKGPIPSGKQLDHIVCDTPSCVNPDHVVPSTARENNARGGSPSGINGRKTHCLRGHELAGSNLCITPRDGFRQCKTCKRDRNRRRLSRAS